MSASASPSPGGGVMLHLRSERAGRGLNPLSASTLPRVEPLFVFGRQWARSTIREWDPYPGGFLWSPRTVFEGLFLRIN